MNRGTRRTVTGVALLMAVVVGLTGCAGRRQGTGSASGTADTEYVVASRDVSAGTSVSGTIRPLQSAALTAQAQGTITAVYKKEGDSVKAGEVIVRIDSASQGNLLAQAESRYRVAGITLKTAEISDLGQTKQQLQSAVNQALAQQLSAEVNLQNFTDKDTSDQTIAGLQQQVKQTKIALTNAQNSLRSLLDYDTSAQQQTLADLSVQQARLNLNTAEAHLVTLATAVPATLQTVIDAQLASIDASRVSLQNAQVNSQITAATIGRGKVQIETARLANEQAQDSVTAAENNLAMTQKTIGARANDLKVLQSNVEQTKSSVTLARSSLATFADTQKKNDLQLQSAREQEKQALLTLQAQQLTSDNYVVKAPWNGTVLAVNVNVGDMATPQTILVKVAQTQAWNVEAYVDEVDILSIKKGQKARVAIDPYPGKEFVGMVSYLGKTLVKTPEGLNAYTLKIRLTTPPATLVDGMAGDATVILSTVRSVLAIPVESLLSEGGKKYVMLITKNARGKAITTKTEIFTGLEGDEYVQVTSGLKTGDMILRQPVATKTPTSSGSPFMGGQ